MMRMRLPDILFKPLQPLINLVIGFIDVSPPLGEDVRVMVVEAELLHDCRHDQRQMAGHVDLAVQEDVMLREHILDVCARDIQVSEDVVLVVLLQGYPLGVLDVVHPQLLLDAVHLMGLPVHDAHYAVDPQITHHPLVFERLHIAQEQAPPQKMLLLGLVIEAQDVTAILLIVFVHYRHCIIYYNLFSKLTKRDTFGPSLLGGKGALGKPGINGIYAGAIGIYNFSLQYMQSLSQKENQLDVSNSASKLPFSLLTQVYEVVGQTKGQSSKNIQRAHLSNMFKELIRRSTDDLVRGYWLSIIKSGPEYEKNELFIGKQILVKSVARSCGMTEKQVREQVNKVGDLGEVAQNSKASQKTMDSFFTKKKERVPLSIEKVFESFTRISRTKGNNSQAEKENILIKLLMDGLNEEVKYVIRWVEGNLKISAGEKTMQKALIIALFEELFPTKMQTEQNLVEYETAIKKASAEYPNEEKLIRTLVDLRQNFEYLKDSCRLTLGIPCKPMLAKPTRGIADILSRFQGKQLTCEYKYDGLRGQVHFNNGVIQIFSRNLENITEAYVDLVDNIRQNMLGKDNELSSFIIDCEIVAVNKNTKQLLPFQVLATRSRKATSLNEIQVHVNLFAFDIIYFNQPITHLTLRERRQYLAKLQPILSSDILRISEHTEVKDFENIDDFLSSAIKFGTEGLMIKDLDSAYTCSRRSWQWVKLKKDYIDGLGDTLDLVPIGALYGSGKRTGLYGSYLLAAYNSDMEVFETICKIGTGFSDEVLQKAHQFFQDKLAPVMPSEYRITPNSQKMDVWFTPSAVWQVKGADFQLSPIYTCGIGEADDKKGIGLRFPRLIKLREDKKPHEATTNEFVIDLYRQQAVVKNSGKAEDEDDFY